MVELQISNRADFEDATWEPYNPQKPWTLAPDANGQATVYARFRDGAGNISNGAALVVQVDENSQPSFRLFLLLVAKN